jgi:hypothetical protein
LKYPVNLLESQAKQATEQVLGYLRALTAGVAVGTKPRPLWKLRHERTRIREFIGSITSRIAFAALQVFSYL